MNEGTISQKLMLFMRGNAMSGAPIISGTNQLPKPPISAGMTTKNTMISPCALTKEFQVWPSAKNCRPGCCSSRRMIMDKATPIAAAMTEKIR